MQTNKRSNLLFQLCASTLIFVAIANGQSSTDQNSMPIFKQHRLGETAKEFFTIAKMWNGTLTTEYCGSILREHKQVEQIDAEGCGNITSALLGLDAKVWARFAKEIPGSVTFVQGKLARMEMTLDKPYEIVVQDMESKLGAKPTETTAKSCSGHECRMTFWHTETVTAMVGELANVDGKPSIVIVEDNSMAKEVHKLDSSSKDNSLN